MNIYVNFFLLVAVIFGADATPPALTKSPDTYVLGDDLVVTASLTGVTNGTIAVTYNDTVIATVTLASSSITASSAGTPVTGVTVVAATGTGEIKVTKTGLVAADDAIAIFFDHSENGDDETFTIAIGCPAITGSATNGDNRLVKSSGNGTDCDQTNYRYGGCVTVFNCVAGYHTASNVTSTCTAGAWGPALPTCTAYITVSATPTNYAVGGEVEVSAALLSSIPAGDFTVTYGGTEVSTVTVADGGTLTKSDASTGVTGVTVDVSTSNTIKVKKTSLTDSDDDKEVRFDHETGTDYDGTFTLAVGCEPITGSTGTADYRSVTSSSGTGCSATNYNLQGCFTIFSCTTGYYAAAVNATCTDSATWSVALPACQAITCEEIPNPTGGETTCSNATTPYGSSCTVTCKTGTLNGTTPVTCGDGNGTTGAWSHTTTAYTCSSSGAAKIATSLLLALFLRMISSLMM